MDTSEPDIVPKISLRSLRSGALVEETYAVLRDWDLGQDVAANLALVRADNRIGAGSNGWLLEVATTLSARFSAVQAIAPLIVLARGGFPLDRWRDCLLWHVGQQDVVFHAFLCDWLYPAYQEGRYRIGPLDVIPFVAEQTAGRLRGGRSLSAENQRRTANDLLRMATEFGLLRGRGWREFTGHRLGDDTFLYVLHALAEREPNAWRITESHDWRMFLMTPGAVEHELLRLHQFQRVHYQAAGTLATLRLPCQSLLAYAESLVR
jgi:hypothetical protein